MNDSVITCDEIVEQTKTVLTSFLKKSLTCKTQNFYILLALLLITMALLTNVSVYCYLINYRAKQKYLLPFHVINNKF